MSKLMEAWDRVLQEAASKDFDKQENALFQIGLILQRHNPHMTPDSDVYEESLSRELLRLALDEQRQHDAVMYLIVLSTKDNSAAASCLFAMSNAQAKVLAEPLLNFMKSHGAKMRPSVAYQALMGLDNLFKFGDEAVLAQIKKADLLDLVDTWSKSKDTLLAVKADGLAAKLEDLVEAE